MPSYKDILAAQQAEVKSPDGLITAQVRGGQIAGLIFQPGSYERYSDTDLARQLEHFSKLIAVQRRRARRNSLKAALGTDATPRPRPLASSRERELRRLEQELDIKFHSEHIKVHVTDAHNWDIRIKPGTTKQVPEELFIREAAGVTRGVLNELRMRLDVNRMSVMGPSFIMRGIAPSQPQ